MTSQWPDRGAFFAGNCKTTQYLSLTPVRVRSQGIGLIVGVFVLYVFLDEELGSISGFFGSAQDKPQARFQNLTNCTNASQHASTFNL